MFKIISVSCLLVFSIHSLQAQQYELLPHLLSSKPISKSNDGFMFGFFSDNEYHTIVIDCNEKKSQLMADVPLLIIPAADSFFYAMNVLKIDSNFQDNIYYEYDSTNKQLLEVDKYLYPKWSGNFNEMKDQVDSFINVKWDYDSYAEFYQNEYSYFQLVSPQFIIENQSYEQFTGGAHPGWSQQTKGFMNYQLQSGEMFDSDLNDNDQSDFQKVFYSIIDTNLNSLQRYLYFKGIAGFWDDNFDETNDTIQFDVRKYDDEEIGDQNELDIYIPDVDYIDFLLYHEDGQMKYAAQAFAFADYASSGDYQFTVIKEMGPVPDAVIPNNSPGFNLVDVTAIVPSVYDFYLSPNKNMLVLICKSDIPNSQIVKIVNMENGKLILSFTINTLEEPIMGEWLNESQLKYLNTEVKNSSINYKRTLILN